MLKDPIILWYNIQIELLKQEITKLKQYPSNTFSKEKIKRLKLEIGDLEIEKKIYKLSKLRSNHPK